jgi:hypothetical protein
VELPTLDSLRKASASFKTPKKLKLGDVLAPDMIPATSRPQGPTLSHMDDRNIDDDDAVERVKVQRALQVIMADWNKLESNFQLI